MIAISAWFLCLLFQMGWKPADPVTACANAKDKVLCAQLLALRDADQIAAYRWVAKKDDKALETQVEKK